MSVRPARHGVLKSALVLGGTGLVGGECIKRLTGRPEFARITVLTRRALPADIQSNAVEAVVLDFDRLHERPESFAATHVFCAMGTTIRKAGSAERFREVDFGYPARAAALAKAAGVRHFLLVSSVGANGASGNLYLRVKGELEQAITDAGFASVTIVRPSVLVGDRKEFRLGEAVATRLSWAFPRQYRAVHVVDVAGALIDASREDRPGVRVIENRDIARTRGIA